MTKKEKTEDHQNKVAKKLKEKAQEQSKKFNDCKHDYKDLPNTYRSGRGGMRIYTYNKVCKTCGDFQSYEDNMSI